MKRNVVFAVLGTRLDRVRPGVDRWQRWRPTVAVCQRDDFVVDRLELLYSPTYEGLAQEVVADIAMASPETKVRLHPLAFEDPWDFESVYGTLHDFAHGYSFDPDAESYLVGITTGTHVVQICLYLLTEARYFPGRLLQASPPGRERGPGRIHLIDLDLSRYDLIATRFDREAREATAFLKSGIATRNAAFNAMIDRIEHVAMRSRAPLLLTGPTGAGKSRLARRIHELKRLRNQVDGALVEVNCATLRGDMAMSTLFGHERGAFTGAATSRAGLLRAADGGVLFLDEIGELGPDEQAMLLHAIEEGRFAPVGSDAEVTSRFQLIAGTNRDLRTAAREGSFRADLLARIDLWTFELPALAERTEDIEPNLDFELDRFAREYGRRVTFNREGRERFLALARAPSARWTGNFRDLSAAVTRLATLAGGERIGVADVEEEFARLARAWADPSGARGTDCTASLLPPGLDRFDRVQLEDVIQVCRASRSLSEAGRALFAASRQRKRSSNDADRLRKYLARYDLTFQAIHEAPAHEDEGSSA